MASAVLPPRLGRDFRWLWSSFTVANLADGILLSAGPLLVTSVTLQPFAVAAAVFAQRLPWIVVGVFAGAIVDRTDRRAVIVVVNAVRAAVLAVLAAVIAADHLSLPIVYAGMFAIGVAETFADNAGSVMVAEITPSAQLGEANSRLLGSRVVTNQLAGPPIGAFLFGLGHAVPFGANVVCFAAAIALVARIRPSGAPDRARTAMLTSDIAEGFRWLWGHAAVRTLAVLITVFNVTFGAAFSILVLYAFERLGMGAIGFGVLMASSALGGVVGSAGFARLERRYTYTALLRGGLLIETFMHLGLVLTTWPVVACSVMALFGIHAVVWGSISSTVRHRAVPSHLLGRVTSVHMIGSVGALALGTLVGGAIAQRWGILAPFWFAFAGAAVTTILVWRSIRDVAGAGTHETGTPSGGDVIRTNT